MGVSREAAQQGLEAETAGADELRAKLSSVRAKAIGGQRDGLVAPGLTRHRGKSSLCSP